MNIEIEPLTITCVCVCAIPRVCCSSFPQQVSMSESELASSDQSPYSSTSSPTIQIVSKSFSERLMGKFFDATQFDFVYEQSGLWSPPIRRTVFLASPAGNICSQDEMVRKLKKAKKTCKRPMFCFFNAFWCS